MADYDFVKKHKYDVCVPILVYLSSEEKKEFDNLMGDNIISIELKHDQYDGLYSEAFKWLFKC